MSSLPLQFLLLTIAGWMTRDQQCVVEYLVLCHPRNALKSYDFRRSAASS